MKRGKTKYWLDTWASQSHLECYIRWETLLMQANYAPVRHLNANGACLINAGSSRMCELGKKSCTVYHRAMPIYTEHSLATFHDSMGFGVELLPKVWGCWYKTRIYRLFISLWILAFWIDLPRTPWFKRKALSQ